MIIYIIVFSSNHNMHYHFLLYIVYKDIHGIRIWDTFWLPIWHSTHMPAAAYRLTQCHTSYSTQWHYRGGRLSDTLLMEVGCLVWSINVWNVYACDIIMSGWEICQLCIWFSSTWSNLSKRPKSFPKKFIRQLKQFIIIHYQRYPFDKPMPLLHFFPFFFFLNSLLITIEGLT